MGSLKRHVGRHFDSLVIGDRNMATESRFFAAGSSESESSSSDEEQPVVAKPAITTK